jgi:hypothetical protein
MRDDKKALQLLHDAAEMGDEMAASELGDIYWDGKGNSDPSWTQTRQDYAEAAKWYLAAAGRGDSGAQFMIGEMYYDGLGVLQDFSQAYFWLNLAASDPVANRLGHEYVNIAREKRDKSASHLTAERLNRTQESLANWRAAPSTDDVFPDWRKNPAPGSDDKRRVTDLIAGSVCSRWDVSTQTEAK